MTNTVEGNNLFLAPLSYPVIVRIKWELRTKIRHNTALRPPSWLSCRPTRLSIATSASIIPAQTPTSSLPGLRVYMADRTTPPLEVQPPSSPRKYWTRRGVAEWLVARLSEDRPTLVGIDHGFSFPLRYFEAHSLPLDWPLFLDDFCHHWPTDEANTYVDFVRDGLCGSGAARSGNPRWRRLTELRAGAAKSVFQFDVQGSVAKSTHAGLPWLRYLRQQVAIRVHFWPFDGWAIAGSSVVAEVYPSLWSRSLAARGTHP